MKRYFSPEALSEFPSKDLFVKVLRTVIQAMDDRTASATLQTLVRRYSVLVEPHLPRVFQRLVEVMARGEDSGVLKALLAQYPHGLLVRQLLSNMSIDRFLGDTNHMIIVFEVISSIIQQ